MKCAVETLDNIWAVQHSIRAVNLKLGPDMDLDSGPIKMGFGPMGTIIALFKQSNVGLPDLDRLGLHHVGNQPSFQASIMQYPFCLCIALGMIFI